MQASRPSCDEPTSSSCVGRAAGGPNNDTATVPPAAKKAADPSQKDKTPAVIEGSEIAVDLTAQTLSTVITEKQIRDLPTLNRNPYDLVALSGNVSPGFRNLTRASSPTTE